MSSERNTPIFKKMLRSKGMRLKLLSWLEFVPDKYMIYMQYFAYMGRLPNLLSPKRFSEKLNWYKLNYRNPSMTVCADKVAVRNYVAQKGLERILVPLYSVFDSPKDFNLRGLPERYVVKFNVGAQRNIIVSDPRSVDAKSISENVCSWFASPASKLGREWAYYNIVPQVLIEKFLEPDSETGLTDYKFFCFDGEPKFLYVVVDRFGERGSRLAVYDLDFKNINVFTKASAPLKEQLPKPDNFDEMVDIARRLSKGFPHVRVDLYNVRGEVYFGEMTFYDGSGYIGYVPDDFDGLVGNMFTLPDPEICNEGEGRF